jgi:hypothetical protein
VTGHTIETVTRSKNPRKVARSGDRSSSCILAHPRRVVSLDVSAHGGISSWRIDAFWCRQNVGYLGRAKPQESYARDSV